MRVVRRDTERTVCMKIGIPTAGATKLQGCAGFRVRTIFMSPMLTHADSDRWTGFGKSKGERREDGGGAEPQERRSTSQQRAPSCPSTSCRVFLTSQPPLHSAAVALQEPSKPPLPALCLAGQAGLTPARCRVPGGTKRREQTQERRKMSARPRGAGLALLVRREAELQQPQALHAIGVVA